MRLQQEKQAIDAAFNIKMNQTTKDFRLEILELKDKLSEEKKEKYMA